MGEQIKKNTDELMALGTTRIFNVMAIKVAVASMN